MKTKKIIFALFCVIMLGAMTGCEDMPEDPRDSKSVDEAIENGMVGKDCTDCSIVYPERGKYGPNILADGFVEAKATGTGRFEYSVRADLTEGASLKIVIKSAKPASYECSNRPCTANFSEWHEVCPVCGGVNSIKEVIIPWGGWNQGRDENWVITYEGTQYTFTVYESGKWADASFILFRDFIIEYYENGATEPTKIKEVKVEETTDYPTYPETGEYCTDCPITYPEKGKYGPNILADGFVEAKATSGGRFEYSVRADLSEGANLKIVLKSAIPPYYECSNRPCVAQFNEWHEKCPVCGGVNTLKRIDVPWGGWNPASEVNWVVTNVGNQFTCTVYESGKWADASIIFTNDIIIEYYENGATEPTKIKEVKVTGTADYPTYPETGEYCADCPITYPEKGKYGPNILADGFVEGKKTSSSRFLYSVRADLSEGASLKIVLKSAVPAYYECNNRPCIANFNEWHEVCPVCGGVNTLKRYVLPWGGWNYGSDINWVFSYINGDPFTCTVYESGKWADASVILYRDFIIEYYENGATEPTKVKQVKVID